jgi:hypothetical protein
MHHRPLAFVLGLVAGATSLTAQNCANTSVGFVPLMDLGTGTYQGFEGGLYSGGANVPPAAHAARGLAAMANVVPRDAAGAPDAQGRVVVLSIGMSNTTQEFSTWVVTANADPNRDPAVTLVDGAQGGQDAVVVADPGANFWTVVDQRLANAGVTPQQVQVVWLKQAIAGVGGGFPGAAQQLQGLLAQIARNLRARYPNVQLCFCSSRTYAGYATSPLNPEPYAYESGFAVKWLIEQQANGDPTLNEDPAAGAVVAPWLAFGPYLWADGLTPRSDGLVWTCADVNADGTHPSLAGRAKVAGLLQDFFTQNAFTAPWYVGSGPGTLAAWSLYGTGCPGVAGVPAMRSNGIPTLGNLNFRIGVERAAPLALAVLWFSDATASLPIAGSCALQIDPAPGLPAWISITNGNGARIEPLPVQNDVALLGAQFFCQWLIDDAAGAPLPGFLGLAVSRPATFTLGL